MKSTLSFTRRSFLKRAALAGIAPLFLPSRIWSADTSPNNQLALGFIGMGTQNRGLLGGFLRHNQTRVLAVCDVDTTRREAAKKIVETFYAGQAAKTDYKECAAYSDFRELIARKDIDGVVIATPDHWHALTAIAAARSGKDIYCEKPMNHTILEGRAMVKAVRENNRVFQVGSMQRSSREFRAACELVRNGAIGKVTKVDVMVGGPPVPCDLPAEPDEPGLNWDLWLGPAPKRPYNSVLSPRGVHKHFPNWRNYREYGGGGVCDWGAHHLDIAHWGLGFDDTGPVEIIPPAKAGAQSGVRLRYANGVEITHKPGNGAMFYGDKGKIYVNRGKFELWIGEEQKAKDVGDCDPMLKEFLPANAVRLYYSYDHLGDWLKSMRSRKPPICDVEIGARSAGACNLINLAYFYGKTLKWDPAKEQFTDGTGDPRWLDRDYREPWKLA
ncbi:MAG TPA: Gfo/Idh/MocA family oxidoreductase [Candidatus Binatia bacterium]|jgi:predicted dehydrogenase|nr:Gfo/Idh/MocA family oxidoreductase [Candidatus Binatia bacterium]